jgi:hypothetical protein
MDNIYEREKFAGEIVGDMRRPDDTSLKAQEKKRFRPRGECAPEPPVMTNMDATVDGKDMRGAFPPPAHEYRAHVTAA